MNGKRNKGFPFLKVVSPLKLLAHSALINKQRLIHLSGEVMGSSLYETLQKVVLSGVRAEINEGYATSQLLYLRNAAYISYKVLTTYPNLRVDRIMDMQTAAHVRDIAMQELTKCNIPSIDAYIADKDFINLVVDLIVKDSGPAANWFLKDVDLEDGPIAVYADYLNTFTKYTSNVEINTMASFSVYDVTADMKTDLGTYYSKIFALDQQSSHFQKYILPLGHYLEILANYIQTQVLISLAMRPELWTLLLPLRSDTTAKGNAEKAEGMKYISAFCQVLINIPIHLILAHIDYSVATLQKVAGHMTFILPDLKVKLDEYVHKYDYLKIHGIYESIMHNAFVDGQDILGRDITHIMDVGIIPDDWIKDIADISAALSYGADGSPGVTEVTFPTVPFEDARKLYNGNYDHLLAQLPLRKFPLIQNIFVHLLSVYQLSYFAGVIGGGLAGIQNRFCSTLTEPIDLGKFTLPDFAMLRNYEIPFRFTSEEIISNTDKLVVQKHGIFKSYAVRSHYRKDFGLTMNSLRTMMNKIMLKQKTYSKELSIPDRISPFLRNHRTFYPYSFGMQAIRIYRGEMTDDSKFMSLLSQQTNLPKTVLRHELYNDVTRAYWAALYSSAVIFYQIMPFDYYEKDGEHHYVPNAAKDKDKRFATEDQITQYLSNHPNQNFIRVPVGNSKSKGQLFALYGCSDSHGTPYGLTYQELSNRQKHVASDLHIIKHSDASDTDFKDSNGKAYTYIMYALIKFIPGGSNTMKKYHMYSGVNYLYHEADSILNDVSEDDFMVDEPYLHFSNPLTVFNIGLGNNNVIFNFDGVFANDVLAYCERMQEDLPADNDMQCYLTNNVTELAWPYAVENAVVKYLWFGKGENIIPTEEAGKEVENEILKQKVNELTQEIERLKNTESFNSSLDGVRKADSDIAQKEGTQHTSHKTGNKTKVNTHNNKEAQTPDALEMLKEQNKASTNDDKAKNTDASNADSEKEDKQEGETK